MMKIIEFLGLDEILNPEITKLIYILMIIGLIIQINYNGFENTKSFQGNKTNTKNFIYITGLLLISSFVMILLAFVNTESKVINIDIIEILFASFIYYPLLLILCLPSVVLKYSLPEEIFFRGVLLNELSNKLGKKLGFFITSIINVIYNFIILWLGYSYAHDELSIQFILVLSQALILNRLYFLFNKKIIFCVVANALLTIIFSLKENYFYYFFTK